MNEVTTHLIIATMLKYTPSTAVPVRYIAEKANIDTTSENLRRITEECWDFVDARICTSFTPTNSKMPHFQLV